VTSDSPYLFFVTLLVLALPLLSAVISVVIAKKFAWTVPLVASALLLASAIATFILFFEREVHSFSFAWFSLGNASLNFSLTLQPITLLLLLVVSLVSFLVHLFSIGYMVDDHGLQRYFSFLGLFTFSMQALVLSDNLLQLFFFWELVGLCSYFLIGHWRDRVPAAEAATKAFLMNRVGDVGLLVGLALLWSHTHTLDLTELAAFHWVDTRWQLAAGLCIFLGVAGKSAQFPLLTWLPDAMEGPTPVSALIHAATMVAAGVFLLARLNFIFTPDAATVIGLAGLVTSVYGAWHALHQFDIKKILAYSTLSQLGLMVMAVGAGAWMGGLLHLFTHAFFKAGLFLGAGAIIHSLHHARSANFDVQDIRNMGGLKDYIPNTFIAFILAAAGLAGLPLFAGFVSKEAILSILFQQAFQQQQFLNWTFVIFFFVISFMTVLYTFRLVKFVFFGEFRARKDIPTLPRTPMIMVLPTAVLALGSIWLVAAVNPVGTNAWPIQKLGAIPSAPAWLASVSVVWVLAASTIAYLIYSKGLPGYSGRTTVLDSIYQKAILKPVQGLASLTDKMDAAWIDRLLHRLVYAQVALAFLIGWIDRYIVDEFVRFTVKVIRSLGYLFRRSAKGNIQGYITWSTLALVIFLFWLLK
jgi:NADH-quinone oxidoreductase subunit L